MAKNKQSSSPLTIEKDLQTILTQSDSHVWTFQDLFQALKGKGYPFLIVLISLPFCQPIQIPGFSTPFGAILIFIGLRMLFGRHIWWPQWILKHKISSRLLKAVIKKSLWFFKILRPLLRKRWSHLFQGYFHYLNGFVVILMGIYLALPLPIPLSNLMAAWALLFIGLGLIEEDGLLICIGYVISLIACAILGILIFWIHAWAVA